MRRAYRGIALTALVVLGPGFTTMHNRLLRSLPARDAAVSAPTVIQLWFAERPEPGLSSITVVGADSSRIATGKVRAVAGDPLAIEAEVTGAMKPGSYQVRWRASGADGHVIRGTVPFRVQ